MQQVCQYMLEVSNVEKWTFAFICLVWNNRKRRNMKPHLSIAKRWIASSTRNYVGIHSDSNRDGGYLRLRVWTPLFSQQWLTAIGMRFGVKIIFQCHIRGRVENSYLLKRSPQRWNQLMTVSGKKEMISNKIQIKMPPIQPWITISATISKFKN